jgi:hypothetical protein
LPGCGSSPRPAAPAEVSKLEQNCPAIGTALPLLKLRDHRSIKKYLEKEDSLLRCVHSSEGRTFGCKSAQTTDLYHSEAFRASEIMNAADQVA